MKKKNKKQIIILIIIGLLIAGLIAHRHFAYISRTDRETPEQAEPVLVVKSQESEDTAEKQEENVLAEPEEKNITSVEKEEKKKQEKAEQKKNYPPWFNNALSFYNKYYPSWQTGKMTSVSSVSSGGFSPDSSDRGTASGTSRNAAFLPSGRSVREVRSGGQSSPASSSSAAVSSGSSGGIPATSGDSSGTTGGTDSGDSWQEDDDSGDDDQQDEPQTPAVTITRSITTSTGGYYVRNNIVVNSDIKGLIVTENVPEGYDITSATPNYSKKSGNTYKWLFYGKSFSDRTVDYQLEGEGTGNISGSYKSTAGSGTISGDSNLGN
jgi:hypothetical protein